MLARKLLRSLESRRRGLLLGRHQHNTICNYNWVNVRPMIRAFRNLQDIFHGRKGSFISGSWARTLNMARITTCGIVPGVFWRRAIRANRIVSTAHFASWFAPCLIRSDRWHWISCSRGRAKPTARRSHRGLSPDEAVRLSEKGLIEVGAHTVTHPVLSALPAAAQQDEIQSSKARLEEILEHPVTSFSYPYGSRSAYTAETVAIVREAGFTCACSNFAGVVWRRTDRFQLPRLLVRDWDGDEFARRLEEWFRG